MAQEKIPSKAKIKTKPTRAKPASANPKSQAKPNPAGAGKWAMRVPRDVAARILALYDEWFVAIGAEQDPAKTAKIRAILDAGVDQTVVMAMMEPVWLVEMLEGTKDNPGGMVSEYKRTRGYILAWAAEQGIKGVRVQMLTRTYPDRTPSLSSVILLVLKRGLGEFGKHHGASPVVGKGKNGR